MNSESIRTQKFLRQLARRLSGRLDCNRVEYLVGIGYEVSNSGIKIAEDNEESDYIYFNPDIYVYRDLHHRKDTDLFRITDLICHKYFPEIVIDRDEFGQLKVDTSMLVRGVYKYQLSVDGKRRRWVKMFPLNSKKVDSKYNLYSKGKR